MLTTNFKALTNEAISEFQVKYTEENMHIIAAKILEACPEVNYYSLTAVNRDIHLTCHSAGPNKKHDLQFCGVRNLKDPGAVVEDNDGYTTP